jgi:hypothetical protein
LPPSDTENVFKNSFTLELAPALLDSHMQLIFRKKSHFVGSQALIYSIKFLMTSLRIPVMMNIIQPYADNLLFETIVPIILVTANDVELFRNEPIEFIRRLECVSA